MLNIRVVHVHIDINLQMYLGDGNFLMFNLAVSVVSCEFDDIWGSLINGGILKRAVEENGVQELDPENYNKSNNHYGTNMYMYHVNCTLYMMRDRCWWLHNVHVYILR